MLGTTKATGCKCYISMRNDFCFLGMNCGEWDSISQDVEMKLTTERACDPNRNPNETFPDYCEESDSKIPRRRILDNGDEGILNLFQDMFFWLEKTILCIKKSTAQDSIFLVSRLPYGPPCSPAMWHPHVASLTPWIFNSLGYQDQCIRVWHVNTWLLEQHVHELCMTQLWNKNWEPSFLDLNI